jgi:hypothetical protein
MSLQEVSGDKYEGKRIGKRWKVPVTSRNYQRNWPMMSRSTENRGTGRARPNGERKLVGIPTHNFMENWESFLCLSVSQTHCRFRHLRTNRMFFSIENVPKSTPDLQYFSPLLTGHLAPSVEEWLPWESKSLRTYCNKPRR